MTLLRRDGRARIRPAPNAGSAAKKAPSQPDRVRPRTRIDPRVAGRRAAVGREAGRRRLVVVVCGVVVLVVITAVLLIAHSPLLSVRHVHVVGNHMTSEQAILQASGLSTHPPLIDINSSAIVNSIEGLPWIDTVLVARSWPDSVTVTVTERDPVAWVAEGKANYAVVDATGRVLEFVRAMPKNLVPISLPVTLSAAGTRLDANGSTLAKVAATVPESILSAIEAVQVGSLGVEITLRSGALVELGQATELSQKMVALDTLLSTPRVTLGAHSSVDLRVPDAPVVTSR